MATLYPYLGGFRIQTETVQVTVTRDEAREIIADALKYMGMTLDNGEGLIPSDSLIWLNLRDSEPFTADDAARLEALEAHPDATTMHEVRALELKRDNARSVAIQRS